MNNRYKLAALVAASSLALLGCKQTYNGGLSFSDVYNSPKSVREYQNLKQQQANGIASGNLTQKRSGNVQFAGNMPRPSDNASSSPAVIPASNTYSVNDDKLSMYGQVDYELPQTTVSPMDLSANAIKLTDTAAGGDFDPEVNRTGQWIVYASTRHRKTADIYRKTVGSATITQLTNDPAEDRMPAVSPDGQYIAFTSNRSGNWDIYLMNADGGPARQLTSSENPEMHPSFSPDGTKLVYCTLGQASGQWEMVVIDIAQPSSKKFIGYGFLPTWSPVDNRIVFQKGRERGTRWYSIWMIELLENGNISAPMEMVSAANAAAIAPNFSPDGKHIVFCTVIDPQADDNTRLTKADVWVMNADGTGKARVTSGPFAHLQPTWSADGSILFVSDRAGTNRSNIWALRPDRALQIASPLSPVGSPSVMVPMR